MIRNNTVFILCLFLLVSCTQKKIKHNEDLDFIQNVIIKNHPGIYNRQDPEFNQRLDVLYNVANDKISKVKTFRAQKKVISEFTQRFEDAHLWVRWRKNQTKNQTQNKYK